MKTQQQLQSRFRGIDESHTLTVDSKPEEHNVIFLTDALEVLQALPNNTLSHLAKALQLLI